MPIFGADIDAGLQRPSAPGPPGGLRHFAQSGGSQLDPATAVRFRSPPVGAAILGGRQHTLKDQAERPFLQLQVWSPASCGWLGPLDVDRR